MVNLVRLFLRNDRELLLASLSKKIERAADALDFETAAFFRDILQKVEWFWSQPRYKIWLHDTVDTIDLHADDEAVYVIVLSQRGRRTLGEIIYAFAGLDDPPRALRDVIDQFYRFHLPKEIHVSHDFEGRVALAAELGKRFGRKLNISVAGDVNRRITAERGIELAKAKLELERRKRRPSVNQILKRIKDEFGLDRLPHRIEAFDVAHISATGFAAAVATWADGTEMPEEYEHWVSDRTSELDTLRSFVATRLSQRTPDLVLVDGGAGQLKAAIEAAGETFVIAAVKPRAKHSSISHFLTSSGTKVAFDQDSISHRLLQRLRDDAHDLANATHRLGRDMLHFYELAAILPSLDESERQELLRELGSIRRITSLESNELKKRFGGRKGERAERDLMRYHAGKSPTPQPLIVPIRFVETDGAAEDLIPIETR
jgi:excinuclease ABC subunit C